MEKKKKPLISGIVTAVIIVIITIITTAVNSVYVFIGGEAIRKDSARVIIDHEQGRAFKRLGSFSEMNDLWISFVSDKSTRYIPDISGFLKMKSLKSLTIKRYDLDEPPISEEQADELRKAGINLTVDNEKYR